MEELEILKYIKNYGTFEIKVKSFNDLYVPSDDVIDTYTITGPTIKVDNNNLILRVVKNILGIKQFELLVDDEVIDILDYDDSADWSLDLNLYEDIPKVKHKVNLRAIGEGINDNLSNDATVYFGEAPIFGVSGLVNSVPTLTRTEDAVDLSFIINTDTGEITSDFNSIFPWNEAEIVEDEHGKFLKMPQMYFRVGVNSTNQITDIAVSPTAHSEGDWFETKPFMYSCYGGSLDNGKLKSKSGVSRLTGQTRTTFRNYAKATGDAYHQLDLYHLTIMAFLFWIEFATTDSKSIMTGHYSGSGSIGGTVLVKTGGTDSLKTPSGYELNYNQMRFHYIEDFYGNLFEFVDGVIGVGFNANVYVTADPSKFAETTTEYERLSYANPSSSYSYPTIASIGWDSTHPFMVLARTIVNSSTYSTYFCQRYSGVGNTTLYTGLSHARVINSGGLYTLTYTGSGNTYSDVGGRLIKEI